LKIAPYSKLSAYGYNQLNVMTYGGGLWRTWFDRDLTLAGKVIVKEPDSDRLTSRYWWAEKPLVKLPNLCIHLQREEVAINKEIELKPLLAMAVVENLFKGGIESLADDKFRVDEKHFASLTNLMAKDLNVRREDIVDFELNLCDQQPAQLVGMHEEFVSAPRLDNLASSFCALDAIIRHSKLDVKANRNHAEVEMIILFDHEEIGSASAQGADSNMANEITTRVSECLGGKSMQDHYRAIRNSFLISADMSHAVHPNYAGKHQPQHYPHMHDGIVIKINANQRYATDSVGQAILKVLADRAQVPIQEFIVRNDSLCGSTIGPIIAAKAGIKTIDVGAPMLAMHSIRETCGTIDLLYYERLFAQFFTNYNELTADLLSE
jgi:aspartyl aminopeptidase